MATSPGQDVPLSLEPITGWRVWRLIERDGVPILHSIVQNAVWEPREPSPARCLREPHLEAPHRAPDRHCTCGYYASRSIQALVRSGALTEIVGAIGTIAMWGTVIEHADGARSRFAYPARLRLVCGPCLEDGVVQEPVIVMRSGPHLTPACDHHALRGSSLPVDHVQAQLLSAYAVDLLPMPELPPEVWTDGSPRRNRQGRVARAFEYMVTGILQVMRFVISALMVLWVVDAVVDLIGVIAERIGGASPPSPP